MSRVLIIGCGGVATVAINKCCQNSDVFTEICIASRTKSKCDALKDKLQPDTKTVITTAKVDADNVEELVKLIESYKPEAVLNLALPYQDLTIMDACLKTKVHYIDTANYEAEDTEDPEWRAIYEKRCKEEGLHTAIETTMYASLDLIKKVLLYLDLIYIDLKIFDEIEHEKYTNVSSKIIKENIQYILESEHRDKVIIRTPLIPTITATDENITKITNFLVNLYPEVKYELLNYNPLASSKYELVGLEYGIDKQYKMFDQKQMQRFYQIVKQVGLKNLIIE